MRRGQPTRFLGIIDRIRLWIQIGIFTDNFHDVFHRTDSPVRPNTVQNGGFEIRVFDCERRVRFQGQIGQIVVDANRKVMMQRVTHQVFRHGFDIAGLKFLGPQTVTTTEHRRAVADDGFHILVQRFANGARFLGPVQNGDTLYIFGQRGQKRINRERPIQMNL